MTIYYVLIVCAIPFAALLFRAMQRGWRWLFPPWHALAMLPPMVAAACGQAPDIGVGAATSGGDAGTSCGANRFVEADGGCGACYPQFGDCDGDISNGCESPLTTSANCGTCGVQCGATESCSAVGPDTFGCEPTECRGATDCGTLAATQNSTPCSGIACDTSMPAMPPSLVKGCVLVPAQLGTACFAADGGCGTCTGKAYGAAGCLPCP